MGTDQVDVPEEWKGQDMQQHTTEKNQNLSLIKGFTLIEILISLALGSLILLLAIIAVRSGTEALAHISRMASINDGIRNGWIAISDDTDYWRSHADESYPYGRDFMQIGEDSSGGVTVNRKRPFREWKTPSDTKEATRSKGGMIDPSSPGAYILHGNVPAIVGFPVARVPDSGHLLNVDYFWQDDFPAGYNVGEWRLMAGIIEGPDPLTSYRLSKDDLIGGDVANIADATTRSVWTTTDFGVVDYAVTPFTLPRGWDPWKVMGDWPSLANSEDGLLPKSGAGVDLVPDDEPHLQAVAKVAFRNLGHPGVMSYAPPGTSTLIATKPVNRSIVTANSGIGEIPGSLSGQPVDPTATPGAEDDFIVGLPSANIPLRVPNIPTDIRIYRSGGGRADQQPSDIQRLNRQFYGMFPPRNGNPGKPYRDRYFTTTPTSNLWSGNLRWMMQDSDAALGWSVGIKDFISTPMGMIYASRAQLNAGTGEWRYDKLLDDWYVDPVRRMWSDSTYDAEANTRYSGRSMRSMLLPHLTWTQQVPSAPTDSLVPAQDLGESGVRLRTGILRWRHSGRDRTLGMVEVSMQSGDESLTMSLPTLGSTWRGARMLWGKD